MGETKNRAREIEKLKEQNVVWRAGLTKEELTILGLAERLDERLVRGRSFSEGCYHLAFFMTRYLELQDIKIVPVVGWVTDGTWKGVTSHAWIEYKGEITDVSLTYTTHPKEQPTGALIVHGRILRKGKASYTYYKNDDPIALQKLEWMRTVPEFSGVLGHKENEHRFMLEIASSKSVKEYLSNAPVGGRFDDISRLVK
ncbi:MAG: hypothetical protein LC539_17015 [Candidatus Thiodiazotropha sp.]|nr:hypothetical protein [Candidatus Thiodiazotropha sp.]